MKLSVRDDMPTLCAIGMLVPVVASLAHEAFGHGVGCLMDRGHITLLTFLVFRCAGADVFADGGGPVGALIVGSMAIVSVGLLGSCVTATRLFLLNLGAITLLWACGQAIEESIAGSHDWGHVAADLRWGGYWHGVLFAIGVLGYVATLRMAMRVSRKLAIGRPMRLLVPYATSVLSAVLLGLLWHGGAAASALDGFLSFGVAPAGYLIVARRMHQEVPLLGAMQRSTALLATATIAWLLFAMIVARGLGPLAYSRAISKQNADAAARSSS